jgi:hypothetical protein
MCACNEQVVDHITMHKFTSYSVRHEFDLYPPLFRTNNASAHTQKSSQGTTITYQALLARGGLPLYRESGKWHCMLLERHHFFKKGCCRSHAIVVKKMLLMLTCRSQTLLAMYAVKVRNSFSSFPCTCVSVKADAYSSFIGYKVPCSSRSTTATFK